MTDSDTLSTHGGLLLAGLAFGAAAQGGFYRNALAVVVALMIAAAAVAAMRVRGPLLYPLEVAVVSFGAWSLMAGATGGSIARASSTAAVSLALAGVFLTMRRLGRGERESILSGVAAIGALVGVSGLVGVAFHWDPLGIPSQGLWRAASTLTYANAAGCLLAMTTLVALTILVRSRSAVAIVTATLNIAALLATISRGAIIAAVLGALVGCVVMKGVGWLSAAVAPAVGASVVVAGLFPSLLESGPARPVFAVAGMLLGLGVAMGLTRVRFGVAGGVALAASVAVVGLVAWSPAGDRILDKRLTVESPVRLNEARAALDVVAARPVTGAGPGRAPLVWTDAETGELLVAEFAHNEYLQTLADTGIVGGVVVAVILVLVIGMVVRGRSFVPALPVQAAAAGALTAFLAQSAVDFMWHVPVLPLMAAALAGMCVPFAPSSEQNEVYP